MPQEVRILQIGDLLIDTDESAQPIIQALRDYRRKFGQIDYLVVCGNITAGGRAKHFKAALKALDTIRHTLFDQAFFSPRELFAYNRVFLVPGARDIPRQSDGTRNSSEFRQFYKDFYADVPTGESFEDLTANGAVVRSLVDLTMIGIPYYMDVADPDAAINTILKALSTARLHAAEWQYIVETPTVLVSSFPPLLSRDGSPRVRQRAQYRALLSELEITVHLVGGPVTSIGREPYHSRHLTIGTGPVFPNQRWSGRINVVGIQQRDWGTGPEPKDLKRETLTVTAHRWPDTLAGAEPKPAIELFGGHRVPTSKEGDGFVYQQIFTELYELLEKGNVAIEVTGLPGKGKTQVYLHCQSQKPRFVCQILLKYNQWGEILEELLKEVERHGEERPIIVIHDQTARAVPGRSQPYSREEIDRSLEDLAASRKNSIIYLRSYMARGPKLPLGFINYELPPLDSHMMEALVSRYSSRLPIKSAHLNRLTGGYLGFTLSLLEQVKTIIEDKWPGARPIEADTSWTLIREALEQSTELEEVTNRLFEVMNEEAGGAELADFILIQFWERMTAQGITERLLDPMVFKVDEVARKLADATPPPRPKDILVAAARFAKAKLIEPMNDGAYRLRELIPFLVRMLRAVAALEPEPPSTVHGALTSGSPERKVFVSYSHRDREEIRPIVELLRSAGFDTWWDENIIGGTSWTNELDRQLTQASCILVFLTDGAWEDKSFVRNEALHSKDKVIPVRLREDVELPLPFKDTQYVSLAGWNRSTQTPQWRALLKSIRYMMNGVRHTAA